MEVEWYGQSAFRLTAGGKTVVIDPFDDVSGLAARGLTFEYPAIAGVDADLVLVTHEHVDHNGVDVIGGERVTIRAVAGRLDSPIGEVVAVASEHDAVAGTQRGANTIFVFSLDGIRVAHFGDFGQRELRDAQADAIGAVDILFIPVGGGLTIGGEEAAAISTRLGARWIVPMHYRTRRISFLEPAEAFLKLMPRVNRLSSSSFKTSELPRPEGPLAVVPDVP